MAEIVFVKPAKGGRVRMPDRNSNAMPAEGMFVPRSSYYERLIVTGDLIVDTDKHFDPKKSADPEAEVVRGARK
jgi:hypothetical protein